MQKGFNMRNLVSEIEKFFEELTPKKTLLVLACLGLILYSNTLGNKLFWDDNDSVVNNQYIRSWQYFPQYFSQNLTAGAGIRDNYWRPLLLISFSLDYKLGGVSPFFYHLQNLFWHVLAGWGVFLVIRKIIKNNFVAFCSAIFFLVHPLQTEAVSYVAGRADPMHSALMFGAVYLFLRAMERWGGKTENRARLIIRKVKNKNKKILPSPPFSKEGIRVSGFAFISPFEKGGPRGICISKYYWWSVGLFVLALLAKERAVVMIGLIVLAVFLFYGNSIFDEWKKKVLIAMPYVFVVGIYFLLRFTVLHFTETFDPGAEATIEVPNLWFKVLAYLKGFAIYEGLILWPAKLYMEKSITIPKSFFDGYVLAGFASLVVWLGAIICSLRKNKYVAFGLLWFLGVLSPSLHVFPIQGLLYEHWLYPALPGLFLVIFLVIYNDLENSSEKIKVAGLILISLLVVGLSIRTIVRNNDWHDPIRFYEKNISLGGYSARVYNNLGMAYSDAQRSEDAIDAYTKAIGLDGQIFPPWYNKGNELMKKGRLEEAEVCYRKTLELFPKYIGVYANLGQLYLNKQDFKAALEILEKGIATNPTSSELLYNAAQVALANQDKNKAREYLDRLYKLNSNDPRLVDLSFMMGK